MEEEGAEQGMIQLLAAPCAVPLQASFVGLRSVTEQRCPSYFGLIGGSCKVAFCATRARRFCRLSVYRNVYSCSTAAARLLWHCRTPEGWVLEGAAVEFGCAALLINIEEAFSKGSVRVSSASSTRGTRFHG